MVCYVELLELLIENESTREIVFSIKRVEVDNYRFQWLITQAKDKICERSLGYKWRCP
jgi:hypothetical protein